MLALCACGSSEATSEAPPEPKPAQKTEEALASIVATCSRCDGAVEVRRKGKPYWEPIAMGGTFRDGDWIRTGDGGAARIRFVSGGHLDLDAKTTLFVEADGGKRGDQVAAVHVAMQSGTASGELDNTDAPIRIRTAEGDVRIAGAGKSQFKLSPSGNGTVDVAVDNGELIVKSSGGERRIEAVKPKPAVTTTNPDKRTFIPRPKPVTAAIGFPQSTSPRIDAKFKCMFGLEIPLRWSAVPGANKYRVVVAKDMSFRSVVTSQELAGTQFAFAPKQPGTYVWRVAARDKRGYGEFGFARRIFCN